MAEIMKLNDGNFEEAVKGNDLVVVDLWAEWCGPCKALSPTIEALSGELDGKVVFGKMNVDENQTTPGKYGVTSIPTLLIFKNGEYTDRLVGFLPKGKIVEKLEKHY